MKMKDKIKYELMNVTPERMECILGGCPKIYEVARVECI